jgi:DivIVA domain-containing protein
VAFSKPPIGKRGYHEDEVDAFLDVVEAELAPLLDDNTALRAWLVDLRIWGVDHCVVPADPCPSYEELAALVTVQAERIAQLEAQVAELTARLGQNSRNSSKPPSSDSPFSKPAPKSLRRASGRKPGGQSGHSGSTLAQVADRMRRCGMSRVAAVSEVWVWPTRRRWAWSGGRCLICRRCGCGSPNTSSSCRPPLPVWGDHMPADSRRRPCHNATPVQALPTYNGTCPDR